MNLIKIEILIYYNIQFIFSFQRFELLRFKYNLYILCIYFDLSFQLIQTMLHTLVLFVHLKWIYNLQLLNGLLNLEILVNTIIFILILLFVWTQSRSKGSGKGRLKIENWTCYFKFWSVANEKTERSHSNLAFRFALDRTASQRSNQRVDSKKQ